MNHLLQPLRNFIYSAIFLLAILSASTSSAQDTCTINDDCLTSIYVQVGSDQGYNCIDGCNLYSAPDDIVSACQMGDFPTVWYQLTTDTIATIVNIEVFSSDFESPVISMFEGSPGCDQLTPVYLSNGNLTCIIGSDGIAKAIGTAVSPAKDYYIAVSSLFSIGGDFELCVSMNSDGSHCVLDRDFEVTARSNGGPLEGPFDPGEKISMCINVNQYTAIGNGCQWFQGIVPVFGNGWDPSSFDSLGQPFNATLNDSPLADTANGIYANTRFAWFDNVGYHHSNINYQIGDFDGNGRLDMCNSLYEMDCPLQGGITGGAVGPCWQNPGDILPAGWFGYGLNGSCPDPGPPIKVDWGDGNTCGCCMGPWSFCFDLTTRGTPDCLGDTTRRKLTLGFYTFADGEVGSWTGGASVCAEDQPLKVSLKALCGRIHRRNVEFLPAVTHGGQLQYQVQDENVSYWEWNISPISAVPYFVNTGPNGFQIQAPVVNDTDSTIHVRGIFLGHVAGNEDMIIRKIEFDILPESTVTNEIKSQNLLKVYPVPTQNIVYIDWTAYDENFTHWSVTDVNGKVVSQSIINDSENAKEKLSLRLNELSDGIYFFNLVSEKNVYATRLVKN